MGISQGVTFTSGTLQFERNVAVHGGGLKLLNSPVVRGGGEYTTVMRGGGEYSAVGRGGGGYSVLSLVAKMQ